MISGVIAAAFIAYLAIGVMLVYRWTRVVSVGEAVDEKMFEEDMDKRLRPILFWGTTIVMVLAWPYLAYRIIREGT